MAPPYQMYWKNADAQIDVVILNSIRFFWLLCPLRKCTPVPRYSTIMAIFTHDQIRGAQAVLRHQSSAPPSASLQGRVQFYSSWLVLFILSRPVQTVLTRPLPHLRDTRKTATPTYNCSRRRTPPSDPVASRELLSVEGPWAAPGLSTTTSTPVWI